METLFSKTVELPTKEAALLTPTTAAALGRAASGYEPPQGGRAVPSSPRSVLWQDAKAAAAHLAALQIAKGLTNAVRDQLDEKDIKVWSDHTSTMLPTGDVVPDVRRRDRSKSPLATGNLLERTLVGCSVSVFSGRQPATFCFYADGRSPDRY